MFRPIEHRANNDLFVCAAYGQIDTQITSLYIFPLVRHWRKLCPFPPHYETIVCWSRSFLRFNWNQMRSLRSLSVQSKNGFARRRVCAIVVVDKHFPLDLIIITINYEQCLLSRVSVSVRARALSPLQTKRNATNPYSDDVELRVNGNIVNIVLRIYESLNRLALFNGKRARDKATSIRVLAI